MWMDTTPRTRPSNTSTRAASELSPCWLTRRRGGHVQMRDGVMIQHSPQQHSAVGKVRCTLKTRPSLRVVVENPSWESPKSRAGGKKAKRRRWSPLKHGPARRLKAMALGEEGSLLKAMAACFVSVPTLGTLKRKSARNKVMAELVAGFTPVAAERLSDGRTPVPIVPMPRHRHRLPSHASTPVEDLTVDGEHVPPSPSE